MYFLWCSRGSAPASVAAVCDRRWALTETPLQVKTALRYLTEIAMLAKRPPPVGTVPCNRLASAHCFFLKNKLDDCPSHFENAHLLSPMNLHLQPQESFFVAIADIWCFCLMPAKPLLEQLPAACQASGHFLSLPKTRRLSKFLRIFLLPQFGKSEKCRQLSNARE